ncbi:DUF1440 domain-containing protein [Chishuiella sp.]|uniref:YagU family protein n=1 Tax=Chishuiella sp. TaxID=1969467 RepID=UPI0028B0D54E|nr:DUF1440 domain-containing protein [Chishuiella sp.]
MIRFSQKIPLLKATILGGILSSFVKFGWEVPFPPRTPQRELTNPPQALLQKLGFSEDITHYSYIFSEQARPINSFIIHFGFCFVFAWLYYWLFERFKFISLYHGALYGVIVYVLFHVIIMPLMGVVPPASEQPIEEHISELFGHIIWAWSIDLIRIYTQTEDKNVYLTK